MYTTVIIRGYVTNDKGQKLINPKIPGVPWEFQESYLLDPGKDWRQGFVEELKQIVKQPGLVSFEFHVFDRLTDQGIKKRRKAGEPLELEKAKA